MTSPHVHTLTALPTLRGYHSTNTEASVLSVNPGPSGDLVTQPAKRNEWWINEFVSKCHLGQKREWTSHSATSSAKLPQY